MSRSKDSLAAIVADYLAECVGPAEEERAWFGSAAVTLEQAIERAALSLCPSRASGALRMHPHQCRVGHDRMGEAATALSGTASLFDQLVDFEDIHRLVRTCIGHIERVGELAIYDVAHRIAMRRDIRPELVHLHCGARAGAAALGLRGGKSTLSPEEFPPEFRALGAEQIEDLLCIFKARLAALRWPDVSPVSTSGCKPAATPHNEDRRRPSCGFAIAAPAKALRSACLVR